MKVLLVNNFFGFFGGAENSTYKTGQVLTNNGHEVFFFATDKKPYFIENYEYSKYFPQYVEFSKLSISQLPKYLLNPTYFYNFEAEKKLDNYLKEIKPDIVHLNCITYYLSPSVINACHKNNIPIVMTLRDPFFACPNVGLMINSINYCKNQLCASGNVFPCLANKCNDNSISKSLISSLEFLFRKFHKLYDKVLIFICTSNAIFELAVKSGIKREKLVLINNFIDDSYLQIQPNYKNKGYFLFAGRLEKEKGVDQLIQAMAKLPYINLHIAGMGSEEEKLKSMASKLNLSNIKFVGFKRRQELAQEYENCITSIIPSDYFEAFGMTILESFSYGKPVIGTNIGGIPEIIEDGINGFVYEPENINELANAIKKINENQDLAISMGKNGRLKTETQYNSNLYYSKLINTYESIISGKNLNVISKGDKSESIVSK